MALFLLADDWLTLSGDGGR